MTLRKRFCRAVQDRGGGKVVAEKLGWTYGKLLDFMNEKHPVVTVDDASRIEIVLGIPMSEWKP
jgi:hypothetical protein